MSEPERQQAWSANNGWPMACVLTVATGRLLVSVESFAPLMSMVIHVSGANIIMGSLVSAGNALREHVRDQLPWLEEAEVDMPPLGEVIDVELCRPWVEALAARHCSLVRLEPVPSGTYPHYWYP